MFRLDKLSLNIPATGKPRLVVIGGGFAGLNLLKHLPRKQFQVVLLDRQNYNGFWPLLYQVATAGLEPDSIAEPFRKLLAKEHDDLHFRLVRVTGINTNSKTVTTLLGDLSYDYLVIATGTKPNYFGNDMIQRYSLPLKRMRHALNVRSQLLQAFEQANMIRDETMRQRMLNVVIAGAGPTGVELAGALANMRKHILQRDYPGVDFSKMNIYLVEGLDRVLPLMSPASSKRAQHYLERMGISIRLNTKVQSYDGDVVTFHDGSSIGAETLIWSAGVTGIIPEGLPPDVVEKGRILVDDRSRVKGMEDVFALGDIALMKVNKYPHGHPGVAQPAMQQGKHLAGNFKRILRGEALKPFRYFDKGNLAIIGRGKAVGDFPGNIHLGGVFVWLTWLLVHVSYSLGFRNKLVVMSNWIYRLFTYQRGNRLIIQPFVQKDDKAGQVLMDNYQRD